MVENKYVEKPRIGDFVTAYVITIKQVRQGVLIGFNADGTVSVRGISSRWVCRPDVAIVPDAELYGDAKAHAEDVRDEIAEHLAEFYHLYDES